MAKVKGPLKSFRARGRFAGVLDFRDYPAGLMHESRVYIQPQRKKPSGLAQEQKQKVISQVSTLWRSLTHEEKNSWSNLAFDYSKYGAEYVWRPDFSPYHKFMSCNIKRVLKGLEPLKSFLLPSEPEPPSGLALPILDYSFFVETSFGPPYNLYMFPFLDYSLEVYS